MIFNNKMLKFLTFKNMNLNYNIYNECDSREFDSRKYNIYKNIIIENMLIEIIILKNDNNIKKYNNLKI